MIKIVMASNNKGKIKEVQEIFGSEFEIISMKDAGLESDVEEDQETFEGNAIKKAETIAKALIGKNSSIEGSQQNREKVWVIADDSGIMVEALAGFPGVRTKRWFDGTDRERNLALIEKLNLKLKESEEENRKIKFVTAIAASNGEESFCELGVIEGKVANSPRGENGFGFDEIFELEDGRTLAELTDEEKNKISARKIALEKIRKRFI